MNRILCSTRVAIVLLIGAVLMASASCTMKSQDPPPLSGPSEFATAIVVSVTPDVLPLDGASQSLVTIMARDATGKALRNLSLHVEISVDGLRADFGSISARNLVTDSNGRATLVYTAPAVPAGPAVDTGTVVAIEVTAIGTNFSNSVSPRLATIRLIPPGVVVPPDGLQPKFTFGPTAPTDHQTVLFDASTSTASSNNPIASYSWNFGDGGSGSGRTASHAFNSAGTYVVTLTVADGFSRTASTTQTIEVSGGATPTASFLTSPSTPRVGENVNFNASASRPATGRTIRTYEWDFGDGVQKTTTTPATTHDYDTAGTFAVTLVVTDDAGRQEVATGSVTVSTDAPTADFSFSQLPPNVSHTMQFNSSTSSVVTGRTIASYSWDFGDGKSSTLASPSHAYGAAASYNVTLTITDSAGKVGRVTKTVAVQ
jgi:PKD repeat protein